MPAFDAIGMDAVGANSTSASNGTASGATMTGTSAFSGGAASGTSASTAAGATLTGTSSFAAGSASGKRSAAASGATLTGISSMQPGAASGSTAPSGPITVPASRKAVFAGVQRVIVFDGKAPVSRPKGTMDELYFVANLAKDLSDANTIASSITYVSSGVAVLEGPELQGTSAVVKLGALDTSPGAKNFFTFRVSLANGEQIDRTILLPVLDDRTGTFGKDPDDIHYYAFDMGKDAIFGNSDLQSVSAPDGVGVSALSGVTIQGDLAIVLIGGMGAGGNPTNTCTFAMTFANTEKIVRTMYFVREDH